MEEFDSSIAKESATNDANSIGSPMRCGNCKQVCDVQNKRSMEMLKKKMLFTDNLITIYTQCKQKNKELRNKVSVLQQKCNDKDDENKLIQAQLKSLLANKDPTETEVQKAKLLDLERVVDNLNDQLKSMDMTCKMYEDKIHEMKEAEANKETDRKNYQSEQERIAKDIKTLNKTIRSLERENLKLKRKNETARERLRKRRSSRSSQATDSEANMSFLSEDMAKTETEDSVDKSFNPLLSDKKKAAKRKRTSSEPAETSDDDPVAHIAVVNKTEMTMSPIVETEEVETKLKTSTNLTEDLASSCVHVHHSSTPKVMLTASMKDHMREMKAKRAYRIFAHHPTNSQLAEMKSIAERLQLESASVEDELKSFCEKHMLVGHEGHVAKKIIKHHEGHFNSTVIEKLKRITEIQKISEMSSAGETDPESSFDQGNKVDFLSPSPKDQNVNALSTVPKTVTSDMKTSDNEPNAANDSHPSIDAGFMQVESSDITTNLDDPGSATDAKGTHQEGKSMEFQDTVLDDNDGPSGMFSSDDEAVSESIASPGDKMKYPSEKIKTVEKVSHRVRTRSMSKSISDGSDSSLSLEKIAFQAEIVLSPLKDFSSGLSGTEERKVTQKMSIGMTDAMKTNKNRKISDENSDKNPVHSKKSTHRKSRLLKRTKHKVSDSADVEQSDAGPSNSKASRLEPEKHFAIIKSDETETRKEPFNQANSKTANTDEEVQQKQNTIQDKKLKKVHPVLSSMHSLPFKVGSDSPRMTSPKASDFNFLPAMDDRPEDMDNDSIADTSFTADKLEAIFADMIAVPLSPLGDEAPSSSINAGRNDDSVGSSDKVLVSGFNSDEDDSRSSISPSAGLCTAISFGEEQKLLKVMASPEMPKKLPQHISSIREAPRRFSCEAPRVALSVPPVKPVTKTKSCDPTLLLGSDKATSFSAQQKMPLNPSEPDAKDVNQTLSHNLSGPFKVVPQTTAIEDEPQSPLSAGMPVDSKKDEGQRLLERDLNTSTLSTSTVPNKKTVDKAKTKESTPLIQSKILFKPLKVTVSKETKAVHRSQQPLGKSKQAVESFSVQDALEHIEKEEINSAGRKLKTKTVSSPPTIKVAKRSYLNEVKHHESFEAVLESVQETAIPEVDSGIFKPVSNLKVISWISGILTYTRRHSTMNGLQKYIESGTGPGDTNLKHILHEKEYLFVQLLATVDDIRSSNSPGFLEKTVIPVVLKTLCRYGHGIGSDKGSFHETQSYLVLSKVFENGSLSHTDTASLTRIYACLCRYCGLAKAMIDLSKYVLLSLSPVLRSRFIIDLFSCWPTVLTQWYPTAGRIFALMLNSRLRSYIGSRKMSEPINNLTSLLEWDSEPTTLKCNSNQRIAAPVEAKWKSLAVQECITKLKNAEVIQSVDGEEPVCRLAVENHDDVFQTLEVICLMEGMNVVAGELIDKEFWPLLNKWSQHYSLSQRNKPSTREVSDNCVVAVLKGLSMCLLVLLTMQKKCHPTQDLHQQAVSYFETICSMVKVFKFDADVAPVVVQCAAVATVLTLSICNPTLAYDTVQSWLIATSDDEKSTPGTSREASARDRRSLHRHEPMLSAFHWGDNLRKTVSWLEREHNKLVENKSGRSITYLLWG